jgi:hypothetical protein
MTADDDAGRDVCTGVTDGVIATLFAGVSTGGAEAAVVVGAVAGFDAAPAAEPRASAFGLAGAAVDFAAVLFAATLPAAARDAGVAATCLNVSTECFAGAGDAGFVVTGSGSPQLSGGGPGSAGAACGAASLAGAAVCDVVSAAVVAGGVGEAGAGSSERAALDTAHVAITSAATAIQADVPTRASARLRSRSGRLASTIASFLATRMRLRRDR